MYGPQCDITTVSLPKRTKIRMTFGLRHPCSLSRAPFLGHFGSAFFVLLLRASLLTLMGLEHLRTRRTHSQGGASTAPSPVIIRFQLTAVIFPLTWRIFNRIFVSRRDEYLFQDADTDLEKNRSSSQIRIFRSQILMETGPRMTIKRKAKALRKYVSPSGFWVALCDSFFGHIYTNATLTTDSVQRNDNRETR